MKTITTVCARDCYDTCSLRVTLDGSERIASIKGDPDHPITQGFICPRGAKDHKRLYLNRVEPPCRRQGQRFEPIGWEDSLDEVSRKLNQTIARHGPESVLYLTYAGNMGLLTTVFSQRLWRHIGVAQTDGALCNKSGRKALEWHYGDSYGIQPLEMLAMELILFWGFNAAVSAPHLWALAQKARRERGAKIIVIDSRQSRTARAADIHIQPTPGSDVALAYGVINQLIQTGAVDHDFIQKWTSGYAHLKAKAGQYTLEHTAQITGVDRKSIETLAQAYSGRRPSATMIGIGLQKCDQGADQVRAVSFIPSLLGLHRGFYYSSGGAFTVNQAILAGRRLAAKEPPRVSQVALADQVQKGAFKFIYIHCMNPAMTLPNQQALRQGLARPDVFVAIHETHWTRTAQYADVVLPAPTFLEKDDLVIPWGHGFVRLSPQVVDPVTDSRDEPWVMRQIAQRLNLTAEELYEAPWKAVETMLASALEGGTFQDLKAGALLTLKTKSKTQYSTPSGKIEFYSSQAAKRGLNPLPKQSPQMVDKDPFILLNSATPQYTSTQFQEVYGPISAVVQMNDGDARRLGVKQGDSVFIANARGRVQVQASVSDRLPEGVLWCPRQFEEAADEPLNALMSSKPQEIGGGPRFNSTRVRVARN